MAKPTRDRQPAGTRLTADEISALAGAGRPQELQAGERAKTRGARLLVVLAGKLRLVRAAAGRTLHTATLSTGECAAVSHPTCCFMAEDRARAAVIDDVASLPPPLRATLQRVSAAVAERETRFLARTALSLHGHAAHLGARARESHAAAQRAGARSAIVGDTLANIPRLPVYVTRLLVLLQDPEVAADEVVESARQDPSLVTELLRYVNSAALGFQNKITDVSHAVMLLGFNRVAQIVVGMGVARTMPDTARFKEVLHHSIAVAHLAFEIARLARVQRPALVSTTALLGDVGRSLLMLIQRERAHEPDVGILCELLDHARVGARLLAHWGIPEEIWRGVELQQLPELVPPPAVPAAYRQPVTVFYLARLSDAYLAGKDDAELMRGFAPEYLRSLPLPEQSISALFNKHIARTLHKQQGKRVFSA